MTLRIVLKNIGLVIKELKGNYEKKKGRGLTNFNEIGGKMAFTVYKGGLTVQFEVKN